MNKLQIFNNKELGLQVRTIPNNDGSISINAEDTAIGFGWTTVAKSGNAVIRWARVNEYCKELGFSQEVGKDTYIPESLFYRLGMKANNSSAEKFQNWLALDVIPSIRKNGGYIAGQETLSDDELMAKALLIAQNKIAERDALIARQQEQIEESKPKAIFADAITSSKTSILIGDFAKILRQNGIEMGQKRFFEWLRCNGYLIKRKGGDWNMPTQKSMELGLFEIKESVHLNGSGCNVITKTPKLTGIGQKFFANKFLAEKMGG